MLGGLVFSFFPTPVGHLLPSEADNRSVKGAGTANRTHFMYYSRVPSTALRGLLSAPPPPHPAPTLLLIISVSAREGGENLE